MLSAGASTVIDMQARFRYRIEPTHVQGQKLKYSAVAWRERIQLTNGEIQRRVITVAKRTTERAWLAEVASVAWT